MNIILIGSPGSGKGTQGVKIAEKYNLDNIVTGDLLREMSESDTDMGKQIKEIVSSGKLVSDELVADVIKTKITDRGFVLDGFPRTLNQAEILKEITNVDLAILFDIDENITVERLLKRAKIENREDDTEEVIRERMKVYKEHTVPLVKFYEEKNILKKISANRSIEEVFGEVCGIIDSL